LQTFLVMCGHVVKTQGRPRIPADRL